MSARVRLPQSYDAQSRPVLAEATGNPLHHLAGALADRLFDAEDRAAVAAGWEVTRGRWGTRTYRDPRIAQLARLRAAIAEAQADDLAGDAGDDQADDAAGTAAEAAGSWPAAPLDLPGPSGSGSPWKEHHMSTTTNAPAEVPNLTALREAVSGAWEALADADTVRTALETVRALPELVASAGWSPGDDVVTAIGSAAEVAPDPDGLASALDALSSAVSALDALSSAAESLSAVSGVEGDVEAVTT